MSSSVAAPARLRALPLDVCVHTAAFCKTGQEGAAEFFLLNQPVISDLAAILNVTMEKAASLKIRKYYRDLGLALAGKLRDPAMGERVSSGEFLTKATEEDPQIMEAFRIVFCKTGHEGATEFYPLNQPVISDLAAILNVTMVEAANLKIKKYYRDMRLAFDGKLRDPATGERVGGGGFLTKATEEDPQIMEAFRIVMEEFTRSEGPKFKRKVRASELERQRKEGVIDDEEYASKKQKLWREEEEALADLEGA